MDDINSNFWQGQNAIWVSHQCSLCTQNIDMQGGPILVQAAVCDGNANVGYRRCAVKNCPLDIADNNRDRFCPVHAYHENACLLCEEEGFQTCEAHASNETAWERYQYRGSYNLRRRAAAAGEEYEAGEYRALKAAF
ncbi:unnamed protein product, partial [Ascophyllum nodosum]